MSIEDPSRRERIKQHFERHKTKYIVGGTAVGGVIVGGVIGASLGKTDVKQLVDSMKLIHIQYKSPNVNLALVKRACPDPIPVLDKLTGEAYPSINRAAQVTGETILKISKDAQGLQERFESLPVSVFA